MCSFCFNNSSAQAPQICAKMIDDHVKNKKQKADFKSTEEKKNVPLSTTRVQHLNVSSHISELSSWLMDVPFVRNRQQ